MIYEKYAVCQNCHKIFGPRKKVCEECGKPLDALMVKHTMFFYLGIVIGLIAVTIAIHHRWNLVWSAWEWIDTLPFILGFIILMYFDQKKTRNVANSVILKYKNTDNSESLPDNVFWNRDKI